MGAVNEVPAHLLIEEQDFAAYLEESEPQAKLIAPPAYRDALHRLLFAPKTENRSVLPFAKTMSDVAFRPGETATKDEINVVVRDQLSTFKAPRHLVVVDEVTRGPNGKADYSWAKMIAAENVG